METKRAAIYVRISQDREGIGAGTDRQERDCRALCKREGFQVVAVYRDDDSSAYSSKPRPEFERMLNDLDAVDVLVYWKTDRLVRRISAIWRVINECEKLDVQLRSVHDSIETATPMGQAIAGVLAAQGEQESKNISIRVKAKHEELARHGKPSGHRRAYGYELDGMTVIKSEARHICEARDRILSGETMTGICNDWNRRGVKPTSAPAWRVTTFKRMITGARIAGRRKHQGVEIGDASWPAIISRTEHEQILRRLGDPFVTKRGRPATYLLTSLVRCGRCGAVLKASTRDGLNGAIWTCRAVPGDVACGRLSVQAQHLEPLVSAAVLKRLEGPKVMNAIAKAAKGSVAVQSPTVDLGALEAKLTQLGVDHDDGLITRAEWLERRARIQSKIDAARKDFSRQTGNSALGALVGVKDIGEYWDALLTDRRRTVVRALVDRVVVNPAEHGGSFDPERVEIVWKV